MTRYLVTGGAGFIGSHIVDELVRRDAQVRVLDNFSTGKRENIAHNLASIEVTEGDLRDLPTVRKAIAEVDYVFHLGAIPSVSLSVADPVACNAVNVTGTLNVLVAARDEGVRRVVYSSSTAVYGNAPALPKREDMLTSPISPYAVSKLAGEKYCLAFREVYGLSTVALRYFNVFGPRQDPASQYAAVVPKFITRMLRGLPPVVYGDGLQSRDFVYVENVVAANLLACESQAAVGQVFNVACGEQRTLLELIGELNEILTAALAPAFAEPQPGDVRHSLASVEAFQAIGYDVDVPFHEGLAKTVDWYREQIT
jgi:UDP-glucose 4-epimerase